MSASLNELIRQLPQDTEKRVEQTRKQFLQTFQGEIRRESGLVLNRDSLIPSKGNSNHVSIPVRVVAGIPTVLHTVDIDPSYWHLLPLVPYHSLLMNLDNAAPRLAEIINNIENNMKDSPIPAIKSTMATDFKAAGNHAKEIAALIEKINPVTQILGINEDVLGSYDYSNDNSPKISLYWAVIGIVANLLSIKPEALTGVVLAHELAHGYSHVGTDIDGERWDTESFHRSDLALVEGIAQYYTHLICERMNSRIPGVFDAYDKLLENQPKVYTTHLNWIDDYSPEVVRMAIIEARRNKVTAISDFESILSKAASRLHQNTIILNES